MHLPLTLDIHEQLVLELHIFSRRVGHGDFMAMQLHAQALRCGSKLIQHCLRTLPFWEAWYAAHPNQVEPFSKVLLPYAGPLVSLA